MCSHLSIVTWSESRSEHVGHGARRDNDERLRVFREAPRRGMAGVENYELSSWHVPGLSELHLRCAGGRLYSPTRIRRRLVVYPGACVMRVAPVEIRFLEIRL